MARLETGPYKPDPDGWTGVFIRGDEAWGYAHTLENHLNGGASELTRIILTGLVELLKACDERKRAEEGK